MTTTMPDDIETRLRELFERQANALPAPERAWDDAPMATVTVIAPPRRSRTALAMILTTAAAVALVVGIVAVAPGDGVHVSGQPGSPAPVRFETKQVRLTADSMTIDAGGHRFTAGGSTVDLNSDPGTFAKYQTIELTWTEHGIEMRLNIYFTSDGHDWWANHITTYNGKSPGDWIDYPGNYFRAPLGQAFTAAHVDVKSQDGRLQFTNLRLQPFLPPAVCQHATGRYAFNIAYDHARIPNDPASGFGFGTPTLLDTTTCAPVANPHAFVYSVALTPTGVARIDSGNGSPNAQHDIDPTQSIDVEYKAPGSTTLRVTAASRSNGQVVATVDIPVTVG